MFSTQHITKVTAVGLVVGAIAAPAASAMPIGGISTQASLHRAPAARQTNYMARAQQLKGGGSRLYYRNMSVGQLAADLAPPPSFSRQDKQLVPNSPTQTPTTIAVAVRHASPSAGSDWTYAAIGAGGALTVALIGLGGALAISQRRSRKPTVLAAH